MPTVDDKFPAQLPAITAFGDTDVIPIQPASITNEVYGAEVSQVRELLIRPLAEAAPAGYSGAAARSVSQVRGDYVNIADFGCVMDGAYHPVTDLVGSGQYAPGLNKFGNFSALQAAMPWVTSTDDDRDWTCATQAVKNVKASLVRGGLWKQSGQPRLYMPGNKNMRLSRTLFLGTDRDGASPDNTPSFVMWTQFDGLITSAIDPGKTADRFGVSLSGTRFGWFRFRVAGDPSLPPDVLCHLARGGFTDGVSPGAGRSSDDFVLDQVQLDGSAKVAALMEYGVEDVIHRGCTYRVDGGGAKCCVLLTKRNAENVVDHNQTHATSGAQVTFIGGKFDKCYLYYDMPAGNVPTEAAALIVDGSGRHTHVDCFYSMAAGDATRIPLVIIKGADNGAGISTRQNIIRPHFHGAFGDAIQLLNATQFLVVEQPFENVGRTGAGTLYYTVHALNGATISRGCVLDVESLKTEPTADVSLAVIRLLSQPGSINIGGNLSGRISAYSNTPVSATGNINAECLELDTGASYRLANNSPRAAPTNITSLDNRAPIVINAAGTITVLTAAQLGPRFATDIINDDVSGGDCIVALPGSIQFTLPYRWVLNVSVNNGKIWPYMGGPVVPPV